MSFRMTRSRSLSPSKISCALALRIALLASFGIAAAALVACDDRSSRDKGAQGSSAGSGSGSIPGTELPPSKSGLDPLVEEFRATERSVLQRYNEALREQRANSIDELELSNTIERDVLTPWRALRAKVTAASPQDELYSTLRRYLEARQVSWEAYVTALRAGSDEAARPHYEAHRQKNAEAQEYAKTLGRLFRDAAARANGSAGSGT